MSERHIKLCKKFIVARDTPDGPDYGVAYDIARGQMLPAHPPELLLALWKCYQAYVQNDWARNAGKVSNDNLDRVEELTRKQR